MALVEFNARPSRSELRRFGIIAVPLAAVLVGMVWGGGILAALLIALAAVAVVVAILRPKWLRPAYLTWIAITFPLTWLFAHLALAAVFFLLITPIGWILRVIRPDPLARAFDREAQSYWTPRTSNPDPRDSLRPY